MCSTLMQSMAVSAPPALPIRRPSPSRIGEVDALRRAQVGKPRVPPPGLDAGEMRRVDIARPPGELRRASRKRGGVLPGAAAEFQHVARLRAQEAGYRRPDGVVVAVKGRAIQPAVGRGRLAGLFRIRRRIPPWQPPACVRCALQLTVVRRRGQTPIIDACCGITQASFVVFTGTIGQYLAASGQARDRSDVVGRVGQA